MQYKIYLSEGVTEEVTFRLTKNNKKYAANCGLAWIWNLNFNIMITKNILFSSK